MMFRRNIEAMPPYTPGEQPAPGTAVIKLNTNENPYPPSPKAVQALRELDGQKLLLYPSAMAYQLCESAARLHDIPLDWVLAGNGSDDLLAMIVLACAEPGRRIVYPSPTYVLYRTLAQMQNAETIEVPYDDDYNLPTQGLIDADGAVTFIARPNSPSGTCPSLEQIERLAKSLRGLVVLDEAYIDFADDDGGLYLARRYDNVIVLRTLSKGYSLAGMRVGYAIANPRILAPLVKVKDSYNVSAASCAVGAAALEDQAHKNANAGNVRRQREKLIGKLRELGFAVLPSQANFVLARPPAGDAECVYLGLKQRNILVRYFKEPRLDDKLRISVGDERQNDALIAAMTELMRP